LTFGSSKQVAVHLAQYGHKWRIEMIILVQRENNHGNIARVGNTNQTIQSHYKTVQGALKFARRYAKGKHFKIKFFHDDKPYGEAFRIIEE